MTCGSRSGRYIAGTRPWSRGGPGHWPRRALPRAPPVSFCTASPTASTIRSSTICARMRSKAPGARMSGFWSVSARTVVATMSCARARDWRALSMRNGAPSSSSARARKKRISPASNASTTRCGWPSGSAPRRPNASRRMTSPARSCASRAGRISRKSCSVARAPASLRHPIGIDIVRSLQQALRLTAIGLFL